MASQQSQDGLTMSQEVLFMRLWDQLQDDATQGLVLQEPIQVNLDNYDEVPGENNIVENQVEFRVEQLHMEPQLDIPLLDSQQSSFLAQLESLPPQGNEQSPSSNMPSSTGYVSATDATTPPPPPCTPPPNQVQQVLPSNVEYPGDYDFQINLGQPTSQAAKSVSWTYSPILKKLFVDKDKSCPIQFKTVNPPPQGSYIRVLPIFKQAENLAEPVTRCPNHVGPPDDMSANHLVLCSDPSTQYFTDQNGRHQLCVPYIAPQVGTEFSKYLFSFKCFISCVGGLNRRKIQLLFTLENNNVVLGRRVLDVRVCACPGRDRKSEEKSREKTKAPPKKPLKRGASKVTSSLGVTSFTKRRKAADEEIFYIPVQGREKYELLMKIKESLDLMDVVTPSQMQQYKQQQAQLNQQYVQLLLPNGTPSLPRVSSFQSTPPSGSQGQALNHTPPPSMGRSQSFPHQQMAPLPNSQSTSQQQAMPVAVETPQFTNLQTYTPSTSTTGLQRQDTRICKDESDGPNIGMEVDSVPTSQGFGVSSASQLTPPNPCPTLTNHTSSSQDPTIQHWLTQIGLKQYLEVFQNKGVYTVHQLDEINLEDLANVPHNARETLWQSVVELRSKLQLGAVPAMMRGGSNTSTISVQSNASPSTSQCYRATRFTLKQTLSFKVEKEDYDDAGM
ncbi:tumor protein 63-like [Diadema antillarum]|uniref:tumor protein 63-like n=1 Tax=Diadema antillarum TaxID=105358 RepID=UPI003A885C9E